MPIPRKTVPIGLLKATPTELTVDALKKQLTEIGLTCPDSAEGKLKEYIEEVKAALPKGGTQTYGILGPALPVSETAGLSFTEVADRVISASRTSRLATLDDTSTGNWEPDATGDGYATTLEYIQFEDHFNWLKANRPSFTGVVDNPPEMTGRYDTVDAVKRLFVQVGTTASATLITGLDHASIESALSNAIAPLNEASASNYDVTDSRVIFLVENYNPTTQEADGIGVLTIQWHLTIKDYKEKKQSLQHATTLTVKSRSVLYSSLDDMYADYNAAAAHFGGSIHTTQAGGVAPEVAATRPVGAASPGTRDAFTAIPPAPTKLKIFDSLPPADLETFRQSLPTLSTTNALLAIVLYAPDLQNVGSIDNTTSAATTTYSQSVTSGFTFSTTQTFSAQMSVEASVEVVKASLTVGFSLSFTEQWSSSKTTTIQFSVPPGKLAFTYQGYLLSALLQFDASTGRFSYLSSARFLTDVLATSEAPLTGRATFRAL